MGLVGGVVVTSRSQVKTLNNGLVPTYGHVKNQKGGESVLGPWFSQNTQRRAPTLPQRMTTNNIQETVGLLEGVVVPVCDRLPLAYDLFHRDLRCERDPWSAWTVTMGGKCSIGKGSVDEKCKLYNRTFCKFQD